MGRRVRNPVHLQLSCQKRPVCGRRDKERRLYRQIVSLFEIKNALVSLFEIEITLVSLFEIENALVSLFEIKITLVS